MEGNIKKISRLIGSSIKLELSFIISTNKLSLAEVVEIYKKNYGEIKNRETIYRILESMLKSEILDKEYDKTRKVLVYFLKSSKIEIDFVEKKIIIS